MSFIESTIHILEGVRERTLATTTSIAETGQAAEILAWRPGPGRAHIAWQLMHVGITEDLFATQRLLGHAPSYPELVDRFRGGSTPDDAIPELNQIQSVLSESRERLVATLRTFTDADLEIIPEPFRERGWTLDKVLQILVWHEAHHQGQAHLTLNLWKAAQN